MRHAPMSNQTLGSFLFLFLLSSCQAQPPEEANKYEKYLSEAHARGQFNGTALVFDDGRFTYFSFPPNREIPAIFYISPAEEETRLNFHMEKEFAVVQRMGRRFVLRLGQAVVGVWNDAYDMNGVPPANGVTVSGVSRVVR